MSETLENKGFLATDNDIAANARAIIHNRANAAQGKCAYLRALIAVTQSDIAAGANPGEAFSAVNKRFYKIVLKTHEKSVPKDLPNRALEVNRRTNYARTAAYAIRTWMITGHDLMAIDATTVTKDQIAVRVAPVRIITPEALRLRVTEQATELEESLASLADLDWAVAAAEMRRVIEALSAKLQSVGAHRSSVTEHQYESAPAL
jgi:hypothetical protein